MTRIDVVAPGPWRVRAFRLALVPCDSLDKGTLLVGVRFPQEAAHLVVADADPPEQILHPAGRIADAEGVKKPLANLLGAAEATGADLLFELVHLRSGQAHRTADGPTRREGQHRPLPQLRADSHVAYCP